MKPLLRTITSANLILLTLVTIWGIISSTAPASIAASDRSSFDVLVGLTAVFCALVHSIVYTYFIASYRFVQVAVLDHGYPDTSVFIQARATKGRAFRAAFLAMAAAMLTAWLYYASNPLRADTAIWAGWSALAAIAAIAVNAYAARMEWKHVVANGVLLDEVLRVVTARRESAAGIHQSTPVGPSGESTA